MLANAGAGDVLQIPRHRFPLGRSLDRLTLPIGSVSTNTYHPAGRSPTSKSKKNNSKESAPVKQPGAADKVVAQNRRARHNYEILDTLECGLQLVGSEVKSLRNGKVSLDEGYGRVIRGEVFLMGCDIAEYTEANRFNHDPRRPRKLLLHKREIQKFANLALEKGLTLVPLKMYFKNGRGKVLMGIGRGRKTYDKREALKKADSERQMRRAVRQR